MSISPVIHIVGGGLSGSEAAWQCLSLGATVRLYEMRALKSTAAHKTSKLAEVVCSNSFKSEKPSSAPGLLKSEMKQFGSLILEAAEAARVPAGQALAVDRNQLSEYVEAKLNAQYNFTRVDQEISEIPNNEELEEKNECWIIATGPLTSDQLIPTIQNLSENKQRLFFYDAISPIIDADSIDFTKGHLASRYSDTGDYLNLPMNKEEYERFIDACIAAEKMPLHEFEKTKYFEACLPIEVMIERGRETLRFGPMKPAGITDPRTGRWPWANVQLRKENQQGSMFNIVGFQTKMKWPEQKKVFSLIPGLENAEFLRYGSIHRNTYIDSPKVLNKDLAFNSNQRVFLAGQLTGVEGYTESTAMGIIAARAAVAKAKAQEFMLPPKETMMGALLAYVTEGPISGEFQPMNANLGLLPSVQKLPKESKDARHERQCSVARKVFDNYCAL